MGKIYDIGGLVCNSGRDLYSVVVIGGQFGRDFLQKARKIEKIFVFFEFFGFFLVLSL